MTLAVSMNLKIEKRLNINQNFSIAADTEQISDIFSFKFIETFNLNYLLPYYFLLIKSRQQSQMMMPPLLMSKIDDILSCFFHFFTLPKTWICFRKPWNWNLLEKLNKYHWEKGNQLFILLMQRFRRNNSKLRYR